MSLFSLTFQHTCDNGRPESRDDDVHTIVIDCCKFNYVDVVGVKTLQTLIADYDKVDIRVVLANCKGRYWIQVC